jgi:hypothetical protein
MRILNYLEIRTFVRSGSFNIDLNQNLYQHPFYAHLNIADIDSGVKHLAFMGHFTKISSASANPANNELLKELKEINVCAILNPAKPYENIRNVPKFKRFVGRCKNYLRHRPRVTIKPYQTVVLPLNISFIHGIHVPEVSLQLDEKLSSIGLVSTGIFPSANKTLTTYVSLHNSSSKTIVLKDLIPLGKVSILQR